MALAVALLAAALLAAVVELSALAAFSALMAFSVLTEFPVPTAFWPADASSFDASSAVALPSVEEVFWDEVTPEVTPEVTTEVTPTGAMPLKTCAKAGAV